MTNVILNLEAIGSYSLRGIDSTYILPKAIAELIQKTRNLFTLRYLRK